MVFYQLNTPRNFAKIPLVALFGAGAIGFVTSSYVLFTGSTLVDGVMPELLIELLILGIPAAGLLYTGLWLATGDFSAPEIWKIGSFALAGVVVAGVGLSLSLIVTSPFALELRELFFLYIGITTEGAFIGVLVGVVRVTDLLHRNLVEQQHEQAELIRQNERLETFASIVSHDLRSPLSVAQGQVELARTECDSDHLQDAQQAHNRMETLIEDLLMLSQCGEAVSETELLPLDQVVKACWANVQTEQATLHVDVQRKAQADRSRFQQLLENLFRNAIEHGDGDVTVRVGELNNGIYIEDNGPGIPEDDRSGVFTAGYSTRENGTGFGLKIVNEIVEAHEWQIHVTDGSEGGARFEITGLELAAE